MAEQRFFSTETAANAVAHECALHADCIDLPNPKASLIAALRREGLCFISSMGTAGRIQPERLRLGTMAEVQGCPLARAIRQRLVKLQIPLDFPVVWSDEPAIKPIAQRGARGIQGSLPFVPQAAGHIMASWIVRTILG